MIINIPLQIDEQRMEEVIEQDYEGKVIKLITDYVKKTLVSRSSTYYGDKEISGMQTLITEQIDKFLDLHKDEVIEKAGIALAEKLVRSKRGKELLEEVCK